MSSHLIQSNRLLTQAALAEWLCVSEWQIWALRRRNELPPAVRVGKALRWREETIRAWLANNEKPSGEFDSVLCARAEKAAAARNQGSKEKLEKGCEPRKKRGRPRKEVVVEGRISKDRRSESI